jgi:hypothetical protein
MFLLVAVSALAWVPHLHPHDKPGGVLGVRCAGPVSTVSLGTKI